MKDALFLLVSVGLVIWVLMLKSEITGYRRRLNGIIDTTFIFAKRNYEDVHGYIQAIKGYLR